MSERTMESQTPVPRFLFKVKNTFIEAVQEDDSLSDLDVDEDAFARRQITEPTPLTLPLLDSVIRDEPTPPALSLFRSLPFRSPPIAKISPKIKEFIPSGACLDKIKSMEDPSENGRSENGRKTSEPFEPEWEPDFRQSYSGTEWPLIGSESFWSSSWNEHQWEPDMERASLRPNYDSLTAETPCTLTWSNTPSTMPYGMTPMMHPPVDGIAVHTLTANSPTDARALDIGDRNDHHSPARKRESKQNLARRRRRESLIDLAARRQKQQAHQAKQKKQSQRQPAASIAPPTSQTPEFIAKGPTVAPFFCHQCGDQCEPHFKFCKYCGIPVSSP